MNRSDTFTITSQTYYNQYTQCYNNILTVNIEPKGPLKAFVRRLRFPQLSSTFRRNSPCDNVQQCGLALSRLGGVNGCCGNNGCEFMTPDDIPDLLSFLLNHGYQLETQITNMMNQSAVKLNDKKLCFTVTYYGKNQPKIVYSR